MHMLLLDRQHSFIENRQTASCIWTCTTCYYGTRNLIMTRIITVMSFFSKKVLEYNSCSPRLVLQASIKSTTATILLCLCWESGSICSMCSARASFCLYRHFHEVWR